MPCVTPSNKIPLAPASSLTIYELLEKCSHLGTPVNNVHLQQNHKSDQYIKNYKKVDALPNEEKLHWIKLQIDGPKVP